MSAPDSSASTHNQRACFITLEGVDGAGKSTHLSWLAEQVAAQSIPVMVSREPGGTELGEQLRALLLHHEMHACTETLLMFAARNEHLEQKIRPALAAGQWVICDRFTDASYAYQGGGRGQKQEHIRFLEQWVQSGLQPDLTFLFDLTPDLARQRLLRGRDRDRFEREQLAFFERTRAAYLDRARQDPHRFCIIDSSRPIEQTRATLAAQIAQLIQRFKAGAGTNRP